MLEKWPVHAAEPQTLWLFSLRYRLSSKNAGTCIPHDAINSNYCIYCLSLSRCPWVCIADLCFLMCGLTNWSWISPLIYQDHTMLYLWPREIRHKLETTVALDFKTFHQVSICIPQRHKLLFSIKAIIRTHYHYSLCCYSCCFWLHTWSELS